MRRCMSAIATAIFFAAQLGAAASQEVRYADPIEAESIRQKTEAVKCPPATEDCKSNFVPKLVNGKRADPGMFPWAVSIGKSGSQDFRGHLCGGSLISDRFILSAAHCFLDTARPEDFRIQLGTVELGGYRDKAAVKRILFQRGFNRATNEADVALLELVTPIQATSLVRWLPLQTLSEFDASGHERQGERIQYTLTGFGLIAPGSRPVRLQYSKEIPSLTTQECRKLKVWSESVFGNALKPDMICAGSTTNVNGSDACKGDSGGGLVLPGANSTFVIAGIVSRGALPDGALDCTQQPMRTGVYTGVSIYAAEIEACINNRGDCRFVAPGQQVASVSPR